MNNRFILYLACILLIFSFENLLVAQCPHPILKQATDFDFNQFQINKLESNEVINWQIKYWPKYDDTNVIIVDSILDNSYLVEGLLESTEYEIYVRNFCTTDSSNWNGPFYETTFLPHESECQIQLDIPDNKCNNEDNFIIKIEGHDDEILGEDIFLSHVNVIISHAWPSDLRLSLISPSGIEVDLSRDIGINTDNYGMPSDVNCNNVLRYDMSACKNIGQIDPSMTGSYIPLGDFIDFENNTSPNGLWQLKVCDKALGDIGQLNYVNLKFSPMICNVPTDISFTNVSDESCTVNWSSGSNCTDVIIEYGPSGFVPGTSNNIAINCELDSYTINDMIPNTEYEFILYTACSNEISPSSCLNILKTNCNGLTHISDFDDQTICDASCSVQCLIDDEVWHNSLEDDLDWLVFAGNTPTESTGPSNDISKGGNYVYIENTLSICSPQSMAILESSCMMIHSNIILEPENCDMEFNYHMSGEDIEQLFLLISTDNLVSWDTLFSKTGHQGDEWINQSIDLSSYDNLAASFRFVAISGSTDLADIALDQIIFYGSEVLNESVVFYRDFDEDSYGNEAETIQSCNNTPPTGYVANALDCNDNDSLIFPGATEIHCNLIDENCNGLDDDQPINNPINTQIVDAKNVFCDGFENGLIKIQASGGNPPYNYLWNNGVDSNLIENIGTGTYICTVTDSDSCKYITKPIHLSIGNTFNINSTVIAPSCIGKSDGTIILNHTGIAPYSYLWSDGSTDSLIHTNIKAGTYWVEISNNICSERDTIIVSANQQIQVSSDITEISCIGNNDGIISLLPFNGANPYNYTWNNGGMTNEISNLIPGKYQCTVQDAEGCENIIDTIEIVQPDSIRIRVDDLDHVTCFGQSNGYIKVSAEGGNAPYEFDWDTSDQGNRIDSLPGGLYSVSVTDNNGCQGETSILEILEKPIISVKIDSIHPVSCPLSFDGHLSVDVSGGTNNYDYFWVEPTEKIGLNTNTLDSLKSGTYSLRVIDDFGCKVFFETEVPLINVPLILTTEMLDTNKCYGDESAFIHTKVNNGTAPFQYFWSNGHSIISEQNKDTILQLSGGSYLVTITDTLGCKGISDTITIPFLNPLDYTIIDWSDPICFEEENGFIQLSGVGGTSPYSYQWNNNKVDSSIYDLASGDYEVTIIDAYDCAIESNLITLSDPDKIMVDINIDYNETSETASIIIQPTTGKAPYHFIWNDGLEEEGFLTTRFQMLAEDYSIDVIDADGCNVEIFITKNLILDVDNKTNLNYDIHIFPNPSTGLFYINTENNRDLAIIIIRNTIGQQLLKIDGQTAINNGIDLSQFKSGCYFLEFKNTNYISKGMRKIILSK